MKAAGVAAQETFKAIVKEAVVEGIREADEIQVSDSDSGVVDRSVLFLGVGMAIGYLLAKHPPSSVRAAEESIADSSTRPIEAVKQATTGSKEPAQASEEPPFEEEHDGDVSPGETPIDPETGE